MILQRVDYFRLISHKAARLQLVITEQLLQYELKLEDAADPQYLSCMIKNQWDDAIDSPTEKEWHNAHSFWPGNSVVLS